MNSTKTDRPTLMLCESSSENCYEDAPSEPIRRHRTQRCPFITKLAYLLLNVEHTGYKNVVLDNFFIPGNLLEGIEYISKHRSNWIVGLYQTKSEQCQSIYTTRNCNRRTLLLSNYIRANETHL